MTVIGAKFSCKATAMKTKYYDKNSKQGQEGDSYGKDLCT